MDIPKLKDDIVRWLKDYADEAGIDTLVVGASGGIDSAVVARLCEKVGRKNNEGLIRPVVKCLAMPMYIEPTSKSLDLAQKLCENRPTHVELFIKPIGDILSAYQDIDMARSQLCQGNLRSRIRANILYDCAHSTNGLVAGTGNKDEDDIGYFTKGGDGLVDICPLSQIHKSQVYKLANILDIPREIIDATPTAGLWDGQTDEEELGMTYDEIEHALLWLTKKLVDDSLTKRQLHVVNMVSERRRKNAHKLKFPPIFQPEPI